MVRSALPVLGLLTLMLPLAADDAPAPAPKPAPPVTVADRLVARTNAARREQKLAELSVNARLTAAAQGLADHMARTGQFSHNADGRTPAQRAEAQQYSWRFIAENIAFRSDAYAETDETARLLMEQWLNSPGHRQNLLSPQPTQCGMGYSVATNGAVYAVQVFAAPSPAPAATPMAPAPPR
jgi:uncharacterized protein YkwD